MTSGILLSGGLDSIALSCWKRPQVAFTVEYGQLASEAETRAASEICRILGMDHFVLQANIRNLGTGDLAGSPASNLSSVPEWWPYRNQFLVTVAGMRAVQAGVDELMVGSVRNDAVHVDGTRQFYDLLSNLMELQEGRLRVTAPAIALSSAELIRCSGIEMGTLCLAHSCHRGNLACGRCRGCNKHFSVMEELGYAPY